ncbi:hypothetical protein Dsin_003045 [Dipteronia sinensis]|uniref:CBM-cenC domain-containing protein n=1 Tax=Dipteronia sinensis TaxID=43782 RepID=A0AAE0B886_9ROSI|nr:hypothetical protein Dsin_003045 [Dipteronia sinensis]
MESQPMNKANDDSAVLDKRADCVGDKDIILNPKFEDGVRNWSGRGGCKIVLHDSMADGKIVPQSGKVFASATKRTQSWNGIHQEITGRVQRKLAYDVTAVVHIFGKNVTTATVKALLYGFKQKIIAIST